MVGPHPAGTDPQIMPQHIGGLGSVLGRVPRSQKNDWELSLPNHSAEKEERGFFNPSPPLNTSRCQLTWLAVRGGKSHGAKGDLGSVNLRDTLGHWKKDVPSRPGLHGVVKAYARGRKTKQNTFPPPPPCLCKDSKAFGRKK